MNTKHFTGSLVCRYPSLSLLDLSWVSLCLSSSFCCSFFAFCRSFVLCLACSLSPSVSLDVVVDLELPGLSCCIALRLYIKHAPLALRNPVFLVLTNSSCTRHEPQSIQHTGTNRTVDTTRRSGIFAAAADHHTHTHCISRQQTVSHCTRILVYSSSLLVRRLSATTDKLFEEWLRNMTCRTISLSTVHTSRPCVLCCNDVCCVDVGLSGKCCHVVRCLGVPMLCAQHLCSLSLCLLQRLLELLLRRLRLREHVRREQEG